MQVEYQNIIKKKVFLDIIKRNSFEACKKLDFHFDMRVHPKFKDRLSNYLTI